MADLFHTGDTELVELRPELWSDLFYDTLFEALPFNDSVARTYEGQVQALGDRIHISQFPQFAAAAELVNEEDQNDADAVTAVGIDLVINKQIVKDFIITDRARVQTLDAMNALRDLAFFAVMKRMQAIIIAATVPSAAAPDHTLAYATPGTLALDDILAAKESLDVQNVRDDGSRVMILDAPAWNDIFQIAGFTSRDFISSGAPLESGSLPARVLGFVPKLTTEASGVSYFYHPSYMQIGVQRGLSAKMYDKGVQGIRAERVNVTLLMGLVQASNIRVVTVS